MNTLYYTNVITHGEKIMIKYKKIFRLQLSDCNRAEKRVKRHVIAG